MKLRASPDRAIELMAPAGSWASLSAALKAGADSVYFGVGKINMRARAANNFQPGDLREIVAKCRKFGAKAYLTLNTLPFLDQILDAGVSVLKLEGRGRSADFVSTVVRAYRRGIDAWKAGVFDELRKSGEGMAELEKVFNRGFWEGGYYLGKTLGEWAVSSNSQATEKKVFAGEITKYYSRIGVAEVLVRAGSLRVGDRIWILGDTTGAVRTEVTELRTGEKGGPVTRADKGVLAAFPVPEKVRRGDRLYLITKEV